MLHDSRYPDSKTVQVQLFADCGSFEQGQTVEPGDNIGGRDGGSSMTLKCTDPSGMPRGA